VPFDGRGRQAPLSGAFHADDLAGRRNKPEHPISITKGQAEATLVLTDTALARAVDDAASHLGHELLNQQFATPGDRRRVDLDGASGRRMPVAISFAVSVMSARSLAESLMHGSSVSSGSIVTPSSAHLRTDEGMLVRL
jgi:hypothetical protein